MTPKKSTNPHSTRGITRSIARRHAGGVQAESITADAVPQTSATPTNGQTSPTRSSNSERTLVRRCGSLEKKPKTAKPMRHRPPQIPEMTLGAFSRKKVNSRLSTGFSVKSAANNWSNSSGSRIEDSQAGDGTLGFLLRPVLPDYQPSTASAAFVHGSAFIPLRCSVSYPRGERANEMSAEACEATASPSHAPLPSPLCWCAWRRGYWSGAWRRRLRRRRSCRRSRWCAGPCASSEYRPRSRR